MKISVEDLRRLLHAPETDAQLVMCEGRIEVRTMAELRSDRFAGALTAISRADLIEQMAQQGLSERDLDQVAARTNTAISNQGA